jgi:hypothetical protein
MPSSSGSSSCWSGGHPREGTKPRRVEKIALPRQQDDRLSTAYWPPRGLGSFGFRHSVSRDRPKVPEASARIFPIPPHGFMADLADASGVCGEAARVKAETPSNPRSWDDPGWTVGEHHGGAPISHGGSLPQVSHHGGRCATMAAATFPRPKKGTREQRHRVRCERARGDTLILVPTLPLWERPVSTLRVALVRRPRERPGMPFPCGSVETRSLEIWVAD